MDLENMSCEVKYDLATNPYTPEDVLRELSKSKDEEEEVRYNVAKNPNAPVDILRDLAKDDCYDVRQNVALNPNTPDDILQELAKDERWQVRFQVANNSKSSRKLLVTLFGHEKSLKEPDYSVLRALYRNAELPSFAKSIIETLFWELL